MRVDINDVGMIVGTCGKGKTRLSLELANGNLEAGKNVMFITAENTERWVAGNIKSEKGWLIVEEMVCTSNELSDIGDAVEKWKNKIGFEPDVLIIDNIEYYGNQDNYKGIDDKMKYLSALQYACKMDIWITLNGRRRI